jgi:hypothetical protein
MAGDEKSMTAIATLATDVSLRNKRTAATTVPTIGPNSTTPVIA